MNTLFQYVLNNYIKDRIQFEKDHSPNIVRNLDNYQSSVKVRTEIPQILRYNICNRCIRSLKN